MIFSPFALLMALAHMPVSKNPWERRRHPHTNPKRPVWDKRRKDKRRRKQGGHGKQHQ